MSAHQDDYLHPRADLIEDLIAAERRIRRAAETISSIRDAARREHDAAQAERIALARRGVDGGRHFEARTEAAGVAAMIARMTESAGFVPREERT